MKPPPMVAKQRGRTGRKARNAARTVIGAEGSFRRNTVVLTAGTFTAQALPLVLYPVFTRMYTPVDFGVYATISLLATLLAILATGAYEHTILIARSRRAAAHIAAYSLVRSIGVIALLFGPLFLFGHLLVRWGLDATVLTWLPLVPAIALAVVVYGCYSEWCVRSRYFGELSRVRIWQASAIAASRLGLGAVLPAFNGYVAGDVLGKVVSAARCGAMFWRNDRPYLHIHTLPRMRAAARRYAHVARYAMPDVLIGHLAGSVHILFIGAAFGAEQLGYVSVVLSMMYVPVTIMSSAIKDVFRQRASVEFTREGSCRRTYRRLVVPITIVAALGFGAVYFVAPFLFPRVLGENWAVTGEYARILTPLFFWNFVSMSLGGVLVIAERTDVSLLWQIVNFVLTVTALVVGTQVLNDVAGALWCYSLARAATYMLYMGLSYRFAKGPSVSSRPV
jgi:O-antigen/teichoic acid export membrane protein